MTLNNPATYTDSKASIIKEEKGTILIVDDESSSIELLKAVLSPIGYNILTALSGKEALNILDKNSVDVILLDIMMPEMNGYEVCKIIKENKKTRMIPVLVISALGEISSNIKAMEVGAEGFVAKPYNTQLVIAYVRSLIQVKKLTDELIKLDQLKDDLTRMIIHDLRNPLISALGFINLLVKETRPDKIMWYSHVVKNGVSDALDLIENLHDITRLENNKLTIKRSDENIYLIIADIIDTMSPIFEKRGLITKLVSDCNLKHNVDLQIIKRVVQNIFTNAAKYANKDSTIMIHAYKKNNSLVIRISNTGDIIPAEYKFKVFEKFWQVELKQKGENIGTGLGLAFCKIAIEAHNGKIWVESPSIDFNDGASIIFEID